MRRVRSRSHDPPTRSPNLFFRPRWEPVRRLVKILMASGRHFRRLTYKFYGAGSFALLDGDMLQWIHGLGKFLFHKSGVLYLATGFDFNDKSRAGFGSIGA